MPIQKQNPEISVKSEGAKTDEIKSYETHEALDTHTDALSIVMETEEDCENEDDASDSSYSERTTRSKKSQTKDRIKSVPLKRKYAKLKSVPLTKKKVLQSKNEQIENPKQRRLVVCSILYILNTIQLKVLSRQLIWQGGPRVHKQI